LLASTALVLMGLWTNRHAPQPVNAAPPLRAPLLLWAISAAVWTLGVWARLTPPGEDDAWLIMAVPVALLTVSAIFTILYCAYRSRGGPAAGIAPWLMLCLTVAIGLVALGQVKWLALDDDPEGPAWLTAWFQRYDGDHAAIHATMIVWLVADVLLLLGIVRRFSGIATWALSVAA